jgi:cytochrome c oxidase assembly factor CtaG
MNIIIISIVTLISVNSKVQKVNKHLGIFQASVITLFSTYLTWNAVIVDDPGQCTAPFVSYGLIFWITIIIGSIFAIGLIIYCTLPISSIHNYNIEEVSDNGEVMEENIISHESYNYSNVNLLFGLSVLYIAMISTNWSVIRYDSQNEEVETSLNWIPVIIDVLLLIILTFMYIWTAISPLFCPSREFNIYKNQQVDV